MSNSESPTEALRRAVKIAGGQSALARIVGCTQGTIWLCLKHGKPLSAKYVLKAEAATAVSRHLLNPDVYPHDDSTPQAPVDASVPLEPAR